MEGKRFIRTLRLQNFLSYGSEGETIELQPLNVLIGANTSGKSNFIEAIGLLRATPIDLTAAIRQGGGISEWLWKGEKEPPIAEIEVIIDYPKGAIPIRYRLNFTRVNQRLESKLWAILLMVVEPLPYFMMPSHSCTSSSRTSQQHL